MDVLDVPKAVVATPHGKMDFNLFPLRSACPEPPGSESIRNKTAAPSHYAAMTGAFESKKKPPASSKAVKYVPQSVLDKKLARLEQLSQAVLDGDGTAIDQLRAELNHCPRLCRRLADLQRRVEIKLIGLVADKDPLHTEAFRRHCSNLRHELLDGEQASLATKMAASRVVITWLFAQLLDLRALESPEELRSIKQLEQAERRYQTAMRTFCMARQADLQLQRMRD